MRFFKYNPIPQPRFISVRSFDTRQPWGALLVYFLLLGMALPAQNNVYPIALTTQPIIGGTVYLGDFANPLATADRLRFTLTLRDPLETQRSVYLRLTVVENGTIVAMTDPSYIGTNLVLQKGVPETLNGADLADYLSVNHLIGVSGQGLTNVLSEGLNEICLEVMDLYRGEPISGKVCAMGYWARLQAPLLTLPIEEAELPEGQLNSLTFNWHMPDPLANLPGSDVQYRFELREAIDGLNPQDQFENLTLIYESFENDFSILYTELPSPLEVGKTYHWRVTARVFDQTGQPIPEYFINNGISQVGTFTVVNQLPPIGGGGSGELCACNDCVADLPPMLPRAEPLQVGEVIKYGVFDMEITDITGYNTGTGALLLPFLGTSVSVNFSNVYVNKDNEAFLGVADVDVNTLIDGIQASQQGALEVLNDADQAWLNQVNAYVAQQLDIFALPLSLKNGLAAQGINLPFDVLVVGMHLSPTGLAEFDLMMCIPDGNGGLYKFGAGGLGFGPNGFNMSDLNLYLLEDAALPGLGNIPVRLLAGISDDPETGSYVAFNCDGMERFNLQAAYTFPLSQMAQAADPTQEVVATFTLSSEQWGQFIGSVDMPPFQVAGLADWTFTVGTAAVDLDTLRNPATLAFPEGYDDPGATWKGFHVGELSVELPADIQLGNTAPLQFSARDLLIDTTGVSCGLEGRNLLNLQTGNAGGWGISLDSFRLNILQNAFQNAAFAGKINVDMLEATIDYVGNLFKDSTGFYAFDLYPGGSFGIDFLKLNVNLDPGSQISIRKMTQLDSVTNVVRTDYHPYANFNATVNMMLTEQDFISFAGSDVGDVLQLLKSALGIGSFDFGLRDLQLEGLRINDPTLPDGRTFGLDGVVGGSIVVAGQDITLDDLAVLEGIIPESLPSAPKLPGLGMDFQLSLGPFGFDVGVWAEKITLPNIPRPRYRFKKLKLNTPEIPRLQFACQCPGAPPRYPPAGNTRVSAYCANPLRNVPLNLPNVVPTEEAIAKVGHFVMTITSMDGNDGEGKIAMPFIGKEISVTFSNAQFVLYQDTLRLLNGYIYTKPSSLIPDNLATQMVQNNTEGLPLDLSALPAVDNFLQQLDGHMASANRLFSLPFSIRKQVKDFLGVELPAGFDFILMGMRFEKDRAKVHCMITFKIPDGPQMKLGIAGLNIRPDGMNLDGVQVYLAEHLRF